MLDFLRKEGVNSRLIQGLADFRKQYPAESGLKDRIRMPRYLYYGTDIWEEALAALLSGEHLLLTGPKATGKNVFAENLAAAFPRLLIRKHEKVSKINVFKGREHGTKSKISY